MRGSRCPGSPQEGKPNLVANFLPVRFREGAFDAGILPFESDEQLADLRTELTETHAMRHENDDVVCVPLRQGAAEVGKQQRFIVGDHRGLRCSVGVASLWAAHNKIVSRHQGSPTCSIRTWQREWLPVARAAAWYSCNVRWANP